MFKVTVLPHIAERSFTGRRGADILLNVFLAIAVDNLGDAEEANEEAEEAELEAAAAAAAAAATTTAGTQPQVSNNSGEASGRSMG